MDEVLYLTVLAYAKKYESNRIQMLGVYNWNKHMKWTESNSFKN